MSPPKVGQKQSKQVKNARNSKRQKKTKEEKEYMALERALWAELESRMLNPTPEDCEEAPASQMFDSSLLYWSTHWDDLDLDGLEGLRLDADAEKDWSEEEMEFTDAEEGETGRSRAPSTSVASGSSNITQVPIRAAHHKKENAIKEKHFNYQRGPEPSKKTITRRKNEKKGRARAAAETKQTAFQLTTLVATSCRFVVIPFSKHDDGILERLPRSAAHIPEARRQNH
ncbi:hypothetical protein BJ508DRAFT_334218 [Ascobolus immersus RN42]|uniref:Uncharacterized protein n=1 Tax=Ascobolus immersus RN42 TaxID=1160509 RepID=A0A3N4HIT5_ASCIM|nr:hypothetical protein BJ508DRAFT_334218 [Ascobolus immersus RN42]